VRSPSSSPAVGLLAAAALLAAPAPDQAPDGGESEWYAKRATWHESLIASLESLAESGAPERRAEPLPDLGASDFSISAWVRTEEGGTILCKAPPTGEWEPQGKAFFIRGGRLCFDIGWVGVVASDREIADGRTHHVVLVKRREHLRFFVDGFPAGSGELEGGPDVPGHVWKIGYTSEGFPDPSGFVGELDEVRVFDRRLSARDVTTLHEHPFCPPLDGQVARWSFDGGDADGDRPSVRVGGRLVEKEAGRALQLDGETRILVEPDAMERLWILLERDFPDERSRREMEWEREDGLWEDRWEAVDWAELGRRYARACHRAKRLEREARALLPTDERSWREARALYLRSRGHALAMGRVEEQRLEPLDRAIEGLRGRHPDHEALLARLEALAERPDAWETAGVEPAELERWEEECRALRRAALLRSPELNGLDRLLFVRRPTYQSSHYYTDYIDGVVHYGGNLCALSLADGSHTDLVPELEGGIFGRHDLSFDAERVVFDHKASPREGFRIFEVGIDGQGLRQLSFPPEDEEERIARYDNSHLGGTGRVYYHQTDDMHPCYLPDGGIGFVSTRCERGILCDGPDILTTTALYRMDADGGGLQLLSRTPVSEEAPSVMNDGRILYTRWEYVDKGGSAVKCLWAMRPDGSGSVEIFGNDHAFPSFYNGRAIPGRNDLFVCIGGPHMPLGVGTVLRLDLREPIRTRRPITYLTPEIDIQSEWGYRRRIEGRWEAVEEGPLYDDPYPLSAELFLVSCNPDRHVHDPGAWGIHLLDALGNRALLHDDPEMSCWQPVPLRPRERPPEIPSVLEPAEPGETLATVVLGDVHRGLDGPSLALHGEHDPEEGVPPGTVRYLRVMETVPRPWSARRFWGGDEHGQQHSVVSLWTHTHVKVLHGIVPVEEDGSACFTVPADRNLFFQALDGDFMEVQRMRTFVNFRPGETRSCIGCHEPRSRAPANRPLAALRRPPRTLMPQPGEVAPRPIHYPTDVQPILDAHCVECHGAEEPHADPDLTGELTDLFSRSYESILERDLVEAVSEIGSKMGNVDDTPPYTWGSHASPLIELVREGHEGVALSREELVRLVTWVDANAPYYGTYFGRKNLRYRDHPDFRPIPTAESACASGD